MFVSYFSSSVCKLTGIWAGYLSSTCSV